ncbi:hypothetical protein [Paenirhodobacter populi]|uniref:Uncharacterized protein n=1 Tax=Paenirhodobacter populi TaxID=2306993 RepID=A0A443IZQ4_9RHOB|nr:hypothetical protein [Sinirhodobacter populi]RWR13818.1 hypothetical protein D2T33_05315 [Sinirhodobacter populi]
MAILMMDNFRTYPTADDMLTDGGRGGPWTTFDKVTAVNQQSLVENPTWRGDGSTLRAFSNEQPTDRRAPQRDFTVVPVRSVCAQFVCGTTGGSKAYTEACNVVLFQEPATDKDTVNAGQLASFYGISIRSTSINVGTADRVGVYYTIMTNASGAINSVLIGYLRPWTRDRHYHVELKVDHTNPLARIIVYVNGVLEMDATYDRDRVDSGFQTKDFKRVLLGGGSGSSSNRPPTYSNLLIYTDEAGTAFPLGPVALETVSPTSGQGYDGLRANPNADDTTYATVLPGGSMSGTFADLAVNPNPVLAVDAVVRHGSVAGIEPSQLTTRVLKSDGSAMGEMITTAAPGVPVTLRRVRLPAGTTVADVNGATFNLSAAG